MRILSYNILKGARGRETAIAEVLQAHQPDIVLLQEATLPYSVYRLAELAGYEIYDSRTGQSTAFLSRIPVQYQWRQIGFQRSPFLEITPEGTSLRIVGVHLMASLSTIMERVRVREIESLLAVTQDYRDQPHVLIGDFNALAPGDRFHFATYPWWLKLVVLFNGLQVRRDALTKLLDAGYVDSFRRCHPQLTGYSIPTPDPNSRLDYAFVPGVHQDIIRDSVVLRDPPAVLTASDHYPIMIDLDL